MPIAWGGDRRLNIFSTLVVFFFLFSITVRSLALPTPQSDGSITENFNVSLTQRPPANLRIDLVQPLSPRTINPVDLYYNIIQALVPLTLLPYNVDRTRYLFAQGNIRFETAAAMTARLENRQVKDMLWALGGTVVEMIRHRQFTELESNVYLGLTKIYLVNVKRNTDRADTFDIMSVTNATIARDDKAGTSNTTSTIGIPATAEQPDTMNATVATIPADLTLFPRWYRGQSINRVILIIILITSLTDSLGEKPADLLVPRFDFRSGNYLQVIIRDTRGGVDTPRMPVRLGVYIMELIAKEYFAHGHTERMEADVEWGGEIVASVTVR